MQGKGAGPVNRVELESQVLCAALRQSCHLKDRIGSFTSVRELSHLFPDLLPPPEKDDDISESNKANFYSVIGIRPQTSANGVISAYLRTVRNFLRRYKVADSRVEYNRILNAGFILRKPRLRLSHDLVVARRWLHEESRLAAMAQAEVTLDREEALMVIRSNPVLSRSEPEPALQSAIEAAAKAGGDGGGTPPPLSPAAAEIPQAAPVPALAASASQSVAAESVPPIPVAPPVVPVSVPPPPVPAAAEVAAPPPVSTPPAVPDQTAAPPIPTLPFDRVGRAVTPAAEAAPRVEVPPVPPLPTVVENPVPASGVYVPPVPPLPAVAREEAKPAPGPAVPPVPPLPAPASDQQISVPPVPPLPNIAPQSTPAPAPIASGAALAAQMEGDIEIAPGVFVPASSVAAAEHQATAKHTPAASVPPVPNTPASTFDVYAAPQSMPAVGLNSVEHAKGSASAMPPIAAPSNAPPVTPPTPTPAPHVAPQPVAPAPADSAGDNGDAGFPPAAVRAQAQQAAASSTDVSQRAPGRISQGGHFVFDESQLRKPQAAANKAIPMTVQLLQAAQFITDVEVQAIMVQMDFAPNIPVEKLILNAGYVTQQEMASVKLGESLLQQGKISMAQFQVAIYDERTSGLRMAESLQVRGWLNTEVRNAIDEFHKKRG